LLIFLKQLWMAPVSHPEEIDQQQHLPELFKEDQP